MHPNSPFLVCASSCPRRSSIHIMLIILSHLKVSHNTFPSSLKRAQKPCCCRGWPLAGVPAGRCIGGGDVAPGAASSTPRTRRQTEPLPGAASPGGSAKLRSLSGSVLGSPAPAQLRKARATLHRSQSFRKAPAPSDKCISAAPRITQAFNILLPVFLSGNY